VCSDGSTVSPRDSQKFGDVPNFPSIGGAFDIAWNSPNCGGFWLITNKGNGFVTVMTAIDTAGAGFSIAETAFRRLNGGQLGDTLEVVAQQFDSGVFHGGK
jgi:hypothetical protein